MVRKRIFITGRVQGVGFRPAVYRIATSLGLSGFIYNDTKGVTIELQGAEGAIDEFIARLKGSDKPVLADIKSCELAGIALVEGEKGFGIKKSEAGGNVISEVSADMTVCEDCLREMRDEGDFRYNYPFIYR